MGLLSPLTGLKNDLFGKDSEQTSSTGPSTGTKNTTDSGQTSNTTNSGSTNTSNQTTTNSGSVNQGYTLNSGSKNVITTGPSESTTSTSDQVNTSQLLLSKEAVDYLIKGILEGNSGLASVSSGKLASGIYNDTATTQLTNDLLARTAGEVAARSAVTQTVIGGTTTTVKNSGSTTTQDIGSSSSNSVNVIGGSTSTSTGSQQIGGSTSSTTTGPRNITENASSSGSSTNVKNDDKGLLDWIICSELHRQGRMPSRLYRVGGKKFLTYSPEILRGYYVWAVPSVRHLRKHPNSLYSKFLEVVFNSRGRDLAGLGSPLDTLTSTAVYLTCLVLSKTLAREFKYSVEMRHG